MNNFVSGFLSGFTFGFLLMAIISVIIGILAVLSLTMDASDLPRPWFGQRLFNTRLSLIFKQVRSIKRWLR